MSKVDDTLYIKEFSPDMIKPNTKSMAENSTDGSKTIVIGKSGSGKSTVIASLIHAKKHQIPVGNIFSGSEDSNGFFEKFMPPTFIFNEYNEDQLKKIIKRQKIARDRIPNPFSLLVLDDLADNSKLFSTPMQQGIFKRAARHNSIFYIISLQYGMDIPRSIRVNTDLIFILREPNFTIRRTLWENFASIIPSFDIFCQMMDQLTNDYCCIAILNQVQTNDWKECVFWYKAPLIPEGSWRFGCPEFWRYHEDRYNKNYVNTFDDI